VRLGGGGGGWAAAAVDGEKKENKSSRGEPELTLVRLACGGRATS
jgi:hypothetical protein